MGGNAVITAKADTTLGILCKDFPQIAVLVEPESLEALVAGIEKSLLMTIPNKIAKNYAREYLDKDMILKRFVKYFE